MSLTPLISPVDTAAAPVVNPPAETLDTSPATEGFSAVFARLSVPKVDRQTNSERDVDFSDATLQDANDEAPEMELSEDSNLSKAAGFVSDAEASIRSDSKYVADEPVPNLVPRVRIDENPDDDGLISWSEKLEVSASSTSAIKAGDPAEMLSLSNALRTGDNDQRNRVRLETDDFVATPPSIAGSMQSIATKVDDVTARQSDALKVIQPRSRPTQVVEKNQPVGTIIPMDRAQSQSADATLSERRNIPMQASSVPEVAKALNHMSNPASLQAVDLSETPIRTTASQMVDMQARRAQTTISRENAAMSEPAGRSLPSNAGGTNTAVMSGSLPAVSGTPNRSMPPQRPDNLNKEALSAIGAPISREETLVPPRLPLNGGETSITHRRGNLTTVTQVTNIAGVTAHGAVISPTAVAIPADSALSMARPIDKLDDDIVPVLAPAAASDRGAIAAPSAQTITTGTDAARHIAQQIAATVTPLKEGVTEITLRPEELGRVTLRLTGTETTMAVILTSDRPETADLMRRHIDMLSQEFKSLGYTNLSFSFGDSGGSQQSQPVDNRGTDDFVADDDTTSANLPASKTQAGLDVRF